MILGVERSGDRRDRHHGHRHQPDEEPGGDADADIGEPAPPLGGDELALRPSELDHRHHDEHDGENTETDQVIALIEKFVHGNR